MRRVVLLLVIGLAVLAAQAEAQVDARSILQARGAPASFANAVQTIVDSALSQGLPTDPIVTKALEGWAKRGMVPPARVVDVLNGLVVQLADGRDATVAAGLDPAPGRIVAAAAEALTRGLSPEQVRGVIESAPAPDAAETGLMVAASLAAQGLSPGDASQAVGRAFQEGHRPEHVMELPSTVADLLSRGIPMSDVARQILSGGGPPGQVGRPGNVPPQKGQGNRPPRP